jgi:polysaccharide biosynthesis protein PslG
MTRPPAGSRTNVSLFIGLWLGLTLMVGLCAFLGLYFGLGGLQPAAPRATEPLPESTAVGPATATPDQGLAATATAPAAATDGPTPEGQAGGGPACNFRPEPVSGFGYGIQSHVFVGDNSYFLGVITDKLGFNWVKMQVRWQDLEANPGDIYWDILDGAMREACGRGLRVMLSLVAAPEWTRANPLPALEGQEAPPDDPQVFANFVGALIERYPGQIGAIEVWNEENLEREWNTAEGISPAAYVDLLRATHATIKAAEPGIIVISGALSPTGINCRGSFPECPASGRPIVVDDVTYLRGFIDAGGLDYADCVGVHSNGTNLPPTADGANPPSPAGYTFTGPWDSPHYSWALRSQVETYASILAGRKPMCVTEFGYAAAIDGVYPPNFAFAADISEEEQAQYLVEALGWMRDSGLVKLAFLFNLDYGPKGGDPATDDNVIFSILTRDGVPRPAFDALGAMPKP